MTTEQSTDSGASIEDRLLASFAPEAAEPEAPAETQEPAAELLDTDGDEQAVPEESTDDLVEVEAEDGTAHKVPAALKDAFLRQADYTRKTQHAATLVQTAEDRLQFAEAREQFTSTVINEVSELRAMQQRLKEFDNVDLGALYNSDPGTAMRVRDQRDDLRREIAKREQGIGTKAQQLQQMQEQHYAKQWSLAVDGVKKAIGHYTPGEDAAMLKQVEILGLSIKEVKGRYADPRILHAIYKAAKYDAIQSRKGAAVETAAKAPPIVKPGASKGPGVAAEQKYRDARDALKKSGSVDAAARLFYLRG
jgi:hypothetical protein